MQKTKVLALILGLLVLGILSLACANPLALIVTPTPTFTPTPTATKTPTSTATTTFTPTFTFTLTYTPTQTSSPTPLPKVLFELLTDGTTLIVDEEIGYQFFLPAGWGAVNLVDMEFNDALRDAAALFPGISSYQAVLEDTADNTGTRIAAVEMVFSTPNDGTSMGISVDPTLSSIDTLLELIVEFYSMFFQDEVEFLRQEVFTNEINATVGVLEFNLLEYTDGYQSLIFFKVGINMVGFTVSSSEELAVDIAPAVQALIHSIQFAAP